MLVEDKKARFNQGWSYLKSGGLALAMMAFSLGCGDREEAPEGASNQERPETIQIVAAEEGEAFNDCVGKECTPPVVGMCEFTREGTGMLLAQLKDYELEPEMGCEDRKYRFRHGIATFDIIDVVAGEAVASPVKMIDHSPSLRNDSLGGVYLIYPREFEGQLFIAQSYPVSIDGAEGLNEMGGAPEFPPGTIIDVPADYESFAAEAADHWEHFDERCPEYSRIEGAYPPEFGEWLYERPAHCNDEDPGTVNQYDPHSRNEDDDL